MVWYWQTLFGSFKGKVWVYLSRFEATCSVDDPFARSADNTSQSQTNTPPLPAGLTTVCLWLLISVRSESFFARADSSRQQTQRGSRILHTCHAFLLTRFTRPLESCKPLPIRWAKQLYHPLHYQQDRQRDALSATRVRFIQKSSEHSVSTENKPCLIEQLTCLVQCPIVNPFKNLWCLNFTFRDLLRPLLMPCKNEHLVFCDTLYIVVKFWGFVTKVMLTSWMT